jgi:ribosomal protein S18 acetylase RimI-like enzyme
MTAFVAPLSFRPIDPDADKPLALAFARDLFAGSLPEGAFENVYEADGARYIDWLKARRGEREGFAVFACTALLPVGMVVLSTVEGEAGLGYVTHYYLVPAARFHRLGDQLDQYACRTLREAGFARARLSVAEKNEPALRFYRRLGWTDAGPRPNSPGFRYLEKDL